MPAVVRDFDPASFGGLDAVEPLRRSADLDFASVDDDDGHGGSLVSWSVEYSQGSVVSGPTRDSLQSRVSTAPLVSHCTLRSRFHRFRHHVPCGLVRRM